MLFKTNNEGKINICVKGTKKAMRIIIVIHQTNKTFSVTVKPKTVCKLEFADH